MLLTILLILSIGFSQELGEWRWADDTSEFKMDKRAHLGTSTGLYFMFRHKDYTEAESILYTFCLGLGKEIVDATLPHEKYGDWGGDGFSKYDLYYDILGIGIGYMVDKLWKPKENSKWERRFNTNSLSISYRLYSK